MPAMLLVEVEEGPLDLQERELLDKMVRLLLEVMVVLVLVVQPEVLVVLLIRLRGLLVGLMREEEEEVLLHYISKAFQSTQNLLLHW